MKFNTKNPQSKKRILICGLGNIGRKHVRILHQFWPGIEKAVMRSGFGPNCPETKLVEKQFFEYEQAINWKPDAAVIASPAPLHLEQALLLAQEHIPLLIEKPIGTGEDPSHKWQDLVRISLEVPILVGYVLRHDPCASFVKEKLRSNCLGPILEADFYCGSWLPDWRPNLDYRQCVSARRDLGGGVLMELSHELDLAQWLLGPIEIKTSSIMQSGLLDIDVEDQAWLLGKARDSNILSIRINFCSHPPRRNMILRGQNGELSWDLLSGTVIINSKNNQDQQFHSNGQTDDKFRYQIEHFLACIDGKAKPICSVSEGIHALNLVDQARLKSIQQEVSKP